MHAAYAMLWGQQPLLWGLLFLFLTAVPIIVLCALAISYADPSLLCGGGSLSLGSLLSKTPSCSFKTMNDDAAFLRLIPLALASTLLVVFDLVPLFSGDPSSVLLGLFVDPTATSAGVVLAMFAVVWYSFATALRTPEPKQYAAINDEVPTTPGPSGAVTEVSVREAYILEEGSGTNLTIAATFGDAADTAHALLHLAVTVTIQFGLLFLFGAATRDDSGPDVGGGEAFAKGFPVKFLTYVITGVIMLLKAGDDSVTGFRLILLQARLLLLRGSRGFALRCNTEDEDELSVTRGPSFALSLLLAVLSSMQIIVSLFVVEYCVQIAYQQTTIKDVLLGFVALLFILDLDKWYVSSMLFRPFRNTITSQGVVRRLESRTKTSTGLRFTVTVEWLSSPYASFSKMESYPRNADFGWQHAQMVSTLLCFHYAIMFSLSQTEGLAKVVGVSEPEQLPSLFRYLARVGFGATLGVYYAERIACVGKAGQQLMMHLAALLILWRCSTWAAEIAADVYESAPLVVYLGDFVSAAVQPFALACFYFIALGRPSGELEVEHNGQIGMEENRLGLASGLALCSFVVHFNFSILPIDALSLFLQAAAVGSEISERAYSLPAWFKDEPTGRAAHETIDATFGAIASMTGLIICWQMGSVARRYATKYGTEKVLGANELVLLAAFSCALLALLGKLALSTLLDATSMLPTFFLTLLLVAIGSFLVAEPLWQGSIHSKSSSTPRVASFNPDATASLQTAQLAAAAAATDASVTALSDAMMVVLEQMASAKNKPADAVARLQSVREALESAQLQKKPPSSRRSASGSNNPFAASAAAPAHVPERFCPDERSRPLAAPSAAPPPLAPQRSGSFPARTGGGSSGSRTPGGTPGTTPRKQAQLSSRKWGCAGS